MINFARVVDFASYHHRNQVRKHSGLPYITHPLDVLKRLASWGVRGEEQGVVWAAAILHDVVEDCRVSPKELVREFGLGVMNIVEELTYDGVEPKEIYLEGFKDKSPRAILIKAADRLCNVDDFAVWGDRDYAAKYLRKARPIFRTTMDRADELVDIFGRCVHDEMSFDFINVCEGLGLSTEWVYEETR